LHSDKYFNYKENAYTYVDEMVDNIKASLEINNHKITSPDLHHYGEYYIFYKPNQRTTWYILFDIVDDTYLITYIFNNHSREASFV
jgi:hypothetical protein